MLPTVSRRRSVAGGSAALEPAQKWRAVTLSTLVVVVAFWSLLAGVVSYASDEGDAVATPAAAIALGFALIPFAFIALAFLSRHPSAPGAVAKAMGLSLLVGLPVAALAGDAVTGVVAGVGAGGVVALRADLLHSTGHRAVAVLIATVYAFVLVRTVGGIALLPAPIFPFTAVALADHWSEWRAERGASPGTGPPADEPPPQP